MNNTFKLLHIIFIFIMWYLLRQAKVEEKSFHKLCKFFLGKRQIPQISLLGFHWRETPPFVLIGGQLTWVIGEQPPSKSSQFILRFDILLTNGQIKLLMAEYRV